MSCTRHAAPQLGAVLNVVNTAMACSHVWWQHVCGGCTYRSEALWSMDVMLLISSSLSSGMRSHLHVVP